MKIYDQSLLISSKISEAAELLQEAFELAYVRGEGAVMDVERKLTMDIRDVRVSADVLVINERHYRKLIKS